MAKLNTPQGQIMSLAEALALEDINGKPLEWKEVEGRPGEYTAVVEKEKQKVGDKEHKKTLPGHKYTYGISPQPAGVIVTMAKETVKSKEEKEEEAEAGLAPAVATEDEDENKGKSKKSKY
jgi:hypothetical protein